MGCVLFCCFGCIAMFVVFVGCVLYVCFVMFMLGLIVVLMWLFVFFLMKVFAVKPGFVVSSFVYLEFWLHKCGMSASAFFHLCSIFLCCVV